MVARGRGRVPSLDGVAEFLGRHGDSQAGSSGPDVDLDVRDRGRASDSLAVRHDASGRVVLAVVADALLYGRIPLGAELGCAPDASTAEVLLAGYERWGRELPDRILGRFAFVVVDRRGTAGGDGVLLAVDHAGSRPLAFHVDADRVAFSSLALALTGVDGVGHELDVDRLAELVLLAFRGTRSVVRGVELVAPGSAVWVTESGVDRFRWWRPEAVEVSDLGSLDAHAERLRAVFDVATADAIDGFSSLGARLSGGLDSTSVVATAARLRPDDRIRAYTSVPPAGWSGTERRGWDADERALVELLAARYPNVSTTFVESVGLGMLTSYEDRWELGAPPERNTMNLMWIRAIDAEAAADGVDLMLTGAAGNRHFSADGPAWLVELARRGRLFRVVSEARAWAASHGSSTAGVLRGELVSPMMPASVRRARVRRRGDMDRAERWVSSTAINEARSASTDVTALMPALSEVDSWGWTRRTDDLFDMAPCLSQSSAVERSMCWFDTADPTADRRVIESALAEPEWWRRHRGVGRAVVRRAMADRLPPEIVDRERRGEQLPDWFDRLLDVREEVVAEVEMARDHPATRDVIDTARLDRLVRDMPARGTRLDNRIVSDYRLALPRALQLSRYARWFEARARRAPVG